MTSSKRKARFKKRIGRKELKKREWETKALKKLEEILSRLPPAEISAHKIRMADKSARTVLKTAELNALFRTLAKEVPEIKKTISQEGITLSARSKNSLDMVLSRLSDKLEYTGVSPTSIKRIRQGKIGKNEFRILRGLGELVSRGKINKRLILETAKELRKDPKYKDFGSLNLSRFVHKKLSKQGIKLSPETVYIHMKKDRGWEQVKPRLTLKQRLHIEKITSPKVPIRILRERTEEEKTLEKFRQSFRGKVPPFGVKLEIKGGGALEVEVSKNIGYAAYRKKNFSSFLIFRKSRGKNEVIKRGRFPRDLMKFFDMQGMTKSGTIRSISTAKKDVIISSMWGRPLHEIAKVTGIKIVTIKGRAKSMGFSKRKNNAGDRI